MNILFVSHLYPTKEDKSTTKALHYITRQWSFKNVVKVIRPIISSEAEYKNPENETLDNVEIIKVKLKRIPIIKKVLIDKELVFSAIDFEPNIIICHSYFAYVGFSFLKTKYSVPLIIGIHNSDVILSDHFMKRRQQKLAFRYANAFAYRSKGTKMGFLNSFPEMKNRMSIVATSGVPEDEVLKKIINLNYFPFRFIYIGSIIKRKNLFNTIKALNELVKPWTLTVVGNGPDMERCKRLVQDLGIKHNVRFKGKINRAEVFTEIVDHSIMIMPSINETFGLVYLEAMAKGLIVIGVKETGIDGIVKNGKNGFLCEDGTFSSIKETVLEVTSLNLTQLNEIRQKSLNTAQLNTDFIAAERYFNFIRKVIKNGK